MPAIPHPGLRAFAASLLSAAGARGADARLVADHLVDANLAGHDSHGVSRVPQYIAAIQSGQIDVAASPRVVAEFPAGAVIDGQLGFGQVVTHHAQLRAIEQARRCGVSAVSVRNCYHTGRVGSYTEQAAAEGMIGIAMVNAGGGGQTVAPFGGLARRLATNPISIAAPSGGEFPLLLDIATSVAPEGKLRAHAQQRKRVPSGWIIDARGRSTNEPNDFYDTPGGALLPLGGAAGYKGFGLAVMIDVLAGALSGAGCCRDEVVNARDGVLLIVLDVARFGPLDAFCGQVRELIAHLKSSPLAPGFDEIFAPGEPEFRQRRRRERDGIELDESTWDQLADLADEFGVAQPPLCPGAQTCDAPALAETKLQRINGEHVAIPSPKSASADVAVR